jgi:hypothetical protein
VDNGGPVDFVNVVCSSMLVHICNFISKTRDIQTDHITPIFVVVEMFIFYWARRN